MLKANFCYKRLILGLEGCEKAEKRPRTLAKALFSQFEANFSTYGPILALGAVGKTKNSTQMALQAHFPWKISIFRSFNRIFSLKRFESLKLQNFLLRLINEHNYPPRSVKYYAKRKINEKLFAIWLWCGQKKKSRKIWNSNESFASKSVWKFQFGKQTRKTSHLMPGEMRENELEDVFCLSRCPWSKNWYKIHWKSLELSLILHFSSFLLPIEAVSIKNSFKFAKSAPKFTEIG